MARKHKGRTITVEDYFEVDVDLESFDDDVILEYAEEILAEKRKEGKSTRHLGIPDNMHLRSLVDNQADLMKLEFFMSVIGDFSLDEIENRLTKVQLRKSA